MPGTDAPTATDTAGGDQVIQLLANSLDTLNATFRDSTRDLQNELRNVSTKLDTGFSDVRDDIRSTVKQAALAFVGAMVISQILMFALVGGSVWVQYKGAAFQVNAPPAPSVTVEAETSDPAVELTP